MVILTQYTYPQDKDRTELFVMSTIKVLKENGLDSIFLFVVSVTVFSPQWHHFPIYCFYSI